MSLEISGNSSGECVFRKSFCCLKKTISKFFSKNKIAVVRLEGVIGSGRRKGLSLAVVDEIITEAFTAKRVKAVAIQLNSPGGAPAQTELVYRRIRQLAEKEEKQVFVFIEDVAASGGYWIACAGDEIYALNTSIIGSIGVISAGFGYVKAIEKIGVERRVYTEGSQKGMLDPFLPENERDVQLLKTLQNDLYEKFKGAVTSRREIKESDLEEVTSGAFWTGERAQNFGLIDKIGTMHEVLEEKYGKDVELVEFEQKQSFFSRLLSNTSLENLPSSLLDTAEIRAWWGRVGM